MTDEKKRFEDSKNTRDKEKSLILNSFFINFTLKVSPKAC